MPLSILPATAPAPPKVITIKAFSDVQPYFAALLSYQQAQAVYLDKQLASIRATTNWLLAQQPVRNLTPDSDVRNSSIYWTVDPAWVVTDAVGVGGGRGFVLGVSTAAADATSTAIPVRAGAIYVLSGFLDLRGLTSGSVAWLLVDAASGATLVTATVMQHTDGRGQGFVTMPPDIDNVKVVLRATSAVVAIPVVASEPQLEVAAPGTQAPEATLYRSNP